MLVAGSVAATGLIAAPVASAQGVDIGGNVPQLAGLVISQPRSSLETFSSAKTYSTSFSVQVTTSEPKASLSIADGEVISGSKVGRLASGSKLLPLPLEARVGRSSAFAPLSSSMDLPLTKFSTIQANGEVKVDLRQKVEKKTTGNYRKLLLVTLSADTP